MENRARNNGGRGASVLISGAGIAGPALAFWLDHHGFAPTLIESAPALRTGGYVVDFWGAGYDLVDRMGLLPQVLAAGYRMREVRIVDATGGRVGGFDVDVFRAATHDRFTSIPRSALSAILYDSVRPRIETEFGNSIAALAPAGDHVAVDFKRGPSRRFDLVIGAGGLHSIVRTLTFGPEARFERFLGYTVAACTVTGYRPRDEDMYVAYSVPARQVARFAMRGDRTMFLFIVADAAVKPFDPHDVAHHRAYLREQFRAAGWECAAILAALDASDDIYFDRVSQIRMPRWSVGRVALVGDAAYAPSLLAGQGSALAIIGAYVLAGELARAATPAQAFASYEAHLRSFIARKQRGTAGLGGAFAPRTRRGIWFRNLVTRAFALPGVARLAIGRSLSDRIALPDYRPTPDR
jgi:2-polyprenyl-6-methoxyphenol hydroxylase-like FAD-dependent oxidoreductase